MKAYKSVLVSRAKQIARDFDKYQVIIVTWDKAHGRTHVTTFGKTVEECAQAAEGGNRVKRALGWPEELCNAKPARAKAVERERDAWRDENKVLAERLTRLQEAFDMQQTANTKIAQEAMVANVRNGRLEMALRDAIQQLQSIANRHLASVAVEHLRAVADES